MVLHPLQLVFRATIGMVRLASVVDPRITTAYLAPPGMANSVFQQSLLHLANQATFGMVRAVSMRVLRQQLVSRDIFGTVIVVSTTEGQVPASQVMSGTE
jgi:hypothetical protein